ncbi:uncharacterized protein DMAD_01040 [Drosophila madeirensis]|uniref:Uncharacterized protein n=1 Tax=Drosophila madeirensis TaxID=30013 RepID=A0AAU9G0Q3_DROMD
MDNQDNKNGDLTATELAKFQYYMEKWFLPPLDLKNDIVYCQRALRDFLKVHSLVSEVFSQQEDADPVAMRRILDELEQEIYEINAECQYQMLRLDEEVVGFLKKLEEIEVKTDMKEANAHVSTLLVPLIANEDYIIIPQNVASRDNEETLIRKHFLLSQEGEDPPMNLSDLDDNIALMLGPTDTTIQIELENGDTEQAETLETSQEQATPTQSQPSVPASLLRSLPDTVIRKVEQSESQPPPLLIANSTLKPQRSLLIPRKQPETFGLQHKKRISSTSPPPLAPITIEFPQAQTEVQETSQAELCFEQMEASRGNLRQVLKRSRKTKQMPRLCYEDNVELTTIETDVKRKPGKMSNVAKALQNTASSSSVAEKPDKQPPTPPPLPSPPLPKRQSTGPGNKTSKLRKTFRKSSPEVQPEGQAARGSPSASSDDSTTQELQQEQQRLSASAAQWRDEPRETRVTPAEYGQETFLRIFGLYTPEVITKLSQRHSKRKRRNVQNASGVDFHYGQQVNATLDTPMGRQKKVKNKPEFLLSPKEKRLQAKKADVRKSKTPDKAAALEASQTAMADGEEAVAGIAAAKCRKCRGECQHCRLCKRLVVGKDDGVCELCDGAFHKDCHQPTKSRLLLQTQKKRCPACCENLLSASSSSSSSGGSNNNNNNNANTSNTSSGSNSSGSSNTTKKSGGAQTV